MGVGPSGFGSSTTAAEVASTVDLTGRVAFVTGANTGIGKETARALASRGSTVFLACRDLEKAEATAKEIRESTNNQNVHVIELDLSSLESVRNCAREYNDKWGTLPIHMLINNAGVMAVTPQKKTKDGFELQFGTNHLGHFLLTHLLLDKLKQGAPSRIVNVSSRAHTRGHINFDDLQAEKSYSPFTAYCQSKLANVLHANELNRRLAGTGVTANSLHPGAIPTELGRNNVLANAVYKLGWWFMKTIEQGAATTVYVAASPQLEGVGGKYFDNCNEATPIEEARDEAVAKRLWEVSESLVGLN
eukprot:TRINITY_DN14597_c0_g1_i1.p1 TRINITY_DN14597_c0_g1~~TRINITY_DN14597_c0_g1_i1.p1  ORF type:complete len:304 (+),score=66.57 TRINITY_DN14597_c0_g1_i1:72-983(+)